MLSVNRSLELSAADGGRRPRAKKRRRKPWPPFRLALLPAALLVATAAGTSQAQLEPLGEPQFVAFGYMGDLAVDPRGRFGMIFTGRVTLSFPARMYDETGAPTTGIFRVRDQKKDRELTPGPIAVDGAGDYLVAWASLKTNGSDSTVQVRFYDNLGKPQTRQFEVESSAPGVSHFLGAAARNRRGDSVLVWYSSRFPSRERLRALRFNARNQPVGAPIEIRTGPTEGPFGFISYEVALDDAGRFVVVWKELFGADKPSRFHFQRFRRDGKKLGGRRLLTPNLPDLSLGGRADIAREPSGEFTIAWMEKGIRLRFYDLFGRPLTGAIKVREDAERDFLDLALARDRFGNAVVLWSQFEPDTRVFETFARVYDRLGQPVGEEVALDPAIELSLGIDDDGKVVIAWTGGDGAHSVQLFRQYQLTCAPGYENRCPRP